MLNTNNSSKTRHRLKVGYVGIFRISRKTKVPARYSQSPGLNLKGDWLKEAGFDTGRGVTVRITEGCLTIIADNNEVQKLREELYKVKQVVKGIKEAVV